MTRVCLEIRWWSFEKIQQRAQKYRWSIPFRYGEADNQHTRLVKGFIVEENEKSYKVLLDYRKGYWNKETYNGFTAFIAKDSIVKIEEAG